MTLLDRITQPETQATVTGGFVTGYALTMNEIIGILTIIVLVGQIGLMLPKYWKTIKGWFIKDEPKG